MKIKLSKFGKILISRPDGREAFLSMRAYLIPRKFKGAVELDIDGVDGMTPSWLDEVVSGIRSDPNLKIRLLPSENQTVKESIKAIDLNAPT